MGLKNWLNRRNSRKETQQRFDDLTEEELQDLNSVEKSAYIEVAKEQVTYRGKINAYNDFPINEEAKQEIDNQKVSEDNDFEEDVPEIEAVPEVQEQPQQFVQEQVPQYAPVQQQQPIQHLQPQQPIQNYVIPEQRNVY